MHKHHKEVSINKHDLTELLATAKLIQNSFTGTDKWKVKLLQKLKNLHTLETHFPGVSLTKTIQSVCKEMHCIVIYEHYLLLSARLCTHKFSTQQNNIHQAYINNSQSLTITGMFKVPGFAHVYACDSLVLSSR